MAREEAFQVEGVVAEALPNGTYRVKLANGHELLGFLTGQSRRTVRLAVADKVMLELSAYDLSQGRIVMERKK
jgi:translation initiation factor IF-1